MQGVMDTIARGTLPQGLAIDRRRMRWCAADVSGVVGGKGLGITNQGVTPNGVDDTELMRRLRAGDDQALALLYDRHAATVYGLARAILHDGALAEELTHDVFLGLWQRPHLYEPSRGSFAGWLPRVARNRAIDVLRRRRERPFAVTRDDQGADGMVDRLIDPDPDPADQAVTNQTRRDVRVAMDQLAPDHQHLLTLAYFEGLTQREIAARLERPLGTVKTQIRTAMRRLANVLVPEPDAPADPGRADGRLESRTGAADER